MAAAVAEVEGAAAAIHPSIHPVLAAVARIEMRKREKVEEKKLLFNCTYEYIGSQPQLA